MIVWEDRVIRQAVPRFEDAEFLMDCMADWPNGGWNLNRALAHVSKPRIQEGKDWHAVFIFEAPRPVGVAGIRYFHSPSGFQVNFLAIHPDFRGKGLFTEFSDALAWWANQYLHCETGRFQVEAPQVKHRAEALNAHIDGNMARLTYDETAKAVKAKYSVTS